MNADLQTIVDEEGYDSVDDLLESVGSDSIVPGIYRACKSIESSCEPDLEDGYCGSCGEYRVSSCLILAGVI